MKNVKFSCPRKVFVDHYSEVVVEKVYNLIAADNKIVCERGVYYFKWEVYLIRDYPEVKFGSIAVPYASH